MEKDRSKHKYYSTQVMLVFRVIICAYIIYQAYLLTKGYIDGDGLNLPVLVIVDIVFFGFGLVFGLLSLFNLLTGRYSGGKLDEITYPENDVEIKDDVDSNSIDSNNSDVNGYEQSNYDNNNYENKVSENNNSENKCD